MTIAASPGRACYHVGVKKSLMVGTGLLILGALTVVGLARGAQQTMLPPIKGERRRMILASLARARPVGTVLGQPGAIPGHSLAAEVRPTTPPGWDQTALAWVERQSNDGLYVAYWDDGSDVRVSLVAFDPAEEPQLAAHAAASGTPGWAMLLEPKGFDKALAGESREDLMNGVIRFDASGQPLAHGIEQYASIPVPGWSFAPLTEKMSSSPQKGKRYMGVLTGALKGRAIVEGVFQGLESGRGQLMVDRVVEVQEEPAPDKGLYELYDEAKIPAIQVLEQPRWETLDPTSVSARAVDKVPSAGSKVYLAVREANPLGRAVLVIDGTLMPAQPGDDPGEVRVSAGDPVLVRRGGKDVAYPPLMFVNPAALIDASSLPN